MSKHNYNNYSKPKTKPEPEEKPVVQEAEPVIEGQTVIPEVTMAPEAEAQAVKLPGIVGNCARLNVREKPNKMADVIAVLEAGSEVRLVSEKPVNGFYNVIAVDGREGYCMCDYISIL